VREDSNSECGGAREEVVRAYLKDPPGWKERVGYGRRWMAETFFSGFKRLFGEVVQAKRFERMVKEIELKVWVYNLMLGMALAPAPALSPKTFLTLALLLAPLTNDLSFFPSSVRSSLTSSETTCLVLVSTATWILIYEMCLRHLAHPVPAFSHPDPCAESSSSFGRHRLRAL
jgi:hypothetical protein